MGKPYSEDLRERIVGAVEAGHSRRAAARMFEVSASCAVKLVRRWRETGSVKPDKMGAPKRSKLDPRASARSGSSSTNGISALKKNRARR